MAMVGTGAGLMSNNFRVGQKVVCVDDAPRFPFHICEVRKGRVYTISQVFADIPSLIVSEVAAVGTSKGFWADRFRPAVERGEETGMSILRKLLTDNKVDA